MAINLSVSPLRSAVISWLTIISLLTLPISSTRSAALRAAFDTPVELSAMIREINEEQVSPEEQLSDYAHVYDQAEKKIVMCKDFEARSIEHRPDRMGR